MRLDNDTTEFLGSGTYGCVFTPPVPCKTKSTQKQKQNRTDGHQVGKVFTDHNAFEKERELMRYVVQHLDPKGEFTVTLQSTCLTRAYKLPSTAKATSHCSTIADNQGQLIYRNGGRDLDDYCKASPTLRRFLAVFRAMLPVFKGLVTLKNAGVIHNDIKPGNMLIHVTKHKVKLIDYGMMEKHAVLFRSYEAIKDALYIYYPPEYKLHNHLITTTKKQDLFNHVQQMLQKTFHGNMDIFDAFGVNYSEDIRQSIEKLGSMRTLRAKQTALRRIASRIDVYQLGMSLAMLMQSMNLLHSQQRNSTLRRIKELVHHMIRCNVFDRWDPEPVYEAAMKIVT